MPREDGVFLAEDYFQNVGGLDTSDSPFIVPPQSAIAGQNFDYTQRGAIRKRAGHSILNVTPDTQLKTLGIGLWDVPGSSREVIRAAGLKIQKYDTNAITFTNLTEDTLAAGSSFLSAGSTIPVVSSMYNSPSNGVLWMAGGGMGNVHGVYSSTKVTSNGVIDAGGSLSTVVAAATSTFIATGKYYYSVALFKASTSVLGNAGLDVSATILNTTDKVTISFSSLSAIDTTKYTALWVFRSAVAGVTGFTTGSLIHKVDISGGVPANYVDTGVDVVSVTNVPRANNVVLDNSPLPSGTYSCLTTWKRRLVTATSSTICISEIDKPESWPTTNVINIPSGGPITGVAIVSYITPYTGASDELLCIFKQRELWIISGSSYQDWVLKQIDNSGCPNQSLIVAANGYLAWVGYRGVYVWDGSIKPIYLSQPIEDQFQSGGVIDKSVLNEGFGIFAQGRNEIQWYLSDTAHATHKYCLRLDLRLTMQDASADAMQRKIRGVFTSDLLSAPTYAAMSCLLTASSTDESIYLGDDAGYLYSGFSSLADAGNAYTLEYVTPFLSMGTPGHAKRFNKVVVWVLNNGTYNLELDYWSNYRYADGVNGSAILPTSANSQSEGLSWDVGKWDVNKWDTSANQVVPLVFNLSSTNGNNNEGDCLRLRLQQTGSTEAVVIYGFTVYYTDLGLRK